MKSLVLAVCLSSLAAAQGPGGGPPPAGGPLPPVPVPAGNPITTAKVRLGAALFFEEQMSSTRTVACATCHIFSAGGSDPRSSANDAASLHPGRDGFFGTPDDVVGSPGVPATNADGAYSNDADFALWAQVTGRKSPTVINAAFVPELFWDGRAAGPFLDPESGAFELAGPVALEVQAADPPVSPVEMAHSTENWTAIAARVAGVQPLALAQELPLELAAFVSGRDYPALFADAFGSPDVTPVRILEAIATYERTLISDATPFDASLVVGPSAMSPLANQGRQVFNGPGRCNLCHSGPLFSDMLFHNIGVRPPIEDEGRRAVTGNPADFGRFKTPHLRNVALRAPYFHNGGAATLADVVAFYDRGGDFGLNQDPRIVPLGLSPQEQAALVAFLEEGLTDPRVANETGPFRRPTLYSETARVPASFGVATPGSGGVEPVWIALEPPHVGNDEFTLAVDGFTGGVPLFLAHDRAVVPDGFTLLGATLYLGLSPALTVLPLGAASGSGAGAGFASLTLPLPDTAALVGTTFFAQTFALDSTAPSGFATTPGLRVSVF
ncbi:MAG: cytochrome c peroxidase [Planctomycetota bacterium]